MCSFKNFKGAILTISHDRQFLKEVCDLVYELTPSGLILDAAFDEE